MPVNLIGQRCTTVESSGITFQRRHRLLITLKRALLLLKDQENTSTIYCPKAGQRYKAPVRLSLNWRFS